MREVAPVWARRLTSRLKQTLAEMKANTAPGDILDLFDLSDFHCSGVTVRAEETGLEDDDPTYELGGRRARKKKGKGKRKAADDGTDDTELEIMCGFAYTFHKCQGLTLDAVIIDLNERPPNAKCLITHAAIYVALSRVRDPRNIYILPPRTGAIASFATVVDLKPLPEVTAFVDAMCAKAHGESLNRPKAKAKGSNGSKAPTQPPAQPPAQPAAPAPATKRGRTEAPAAQQPPRPRPAGQPSATRATPAEPTAKRGRATAADGVGVPDRPAPQPLAESPAGALFGFENEGMTKCWLIAMVQVLLVRCSQARERLGQLAEPCPLDDFFRRCCSVDPRVRPKLTRSVFGRLFGRHMNWDTQQDPLEILRLLQNSHFKPDRPQSGHWSWDVFVCDYNQMMYARHAEPHTPDHEYLSEAAHPQTVLTVSGVAGTRPATVQEAFDRDLRPEPTAGATCDACGRSAELSPRKCFTRLPPVLLVAVNPVRDQSVVNGPRLDRGVLLAERLTVSEGDPNHPISTVQYVCTGVVLRPAVAADNNSLGHFTALTKETGNRWVYFDDAQWRYDRPPWDPQSVANPLHVFLVRFERLEGSGV